MSSAELVELLARELAHGLAAGQLAVGVFELFAQLQPVETPSAVTYSLTSLDLYHAIVDCS